MTNSHSESLDPDLSEINATDAKNAFGEVLLQARRGVRYQINRNGHPIAVILSFSHFEQVVGESSQDEAEAQKILDSLAEIASTEAKNTFGHILSEILTGTRYSVMRNRHPWVVILDYEDYHALWRKARANTGAKRGPGTERRGS